MLLLGIACMVVLYLAAIGPYWNISPDSATYVGWGRSLARGQAFGLPMIQPPMTSIVFAGVLRVFPTGYVALNVMTPLLIFLSLWLAFVLLRRDAGPVQALLVVLLSLAAIQLNHQSTQLLSEPSYMVFSMATLLLLECPADGSLAARSSMRREMLGGLLLMLCVMTRTIGLTLAVAVLLLEGVALIRRQRRPRLVPIAFALLAFLVVAVWQAETGGGYVSSWFSTLFGPASGSRSINLTMLSAIGALLLNQRPTGSGLGVILEGGAVLAVVAGLWGGLRRRIGLLPLYLSLYLLVITAHMVLGGDNDSRLLVPVAPLLFAYALEALRRLGGWGESRRMGALSAVALGAGGAALLAFYLGLGARAALKSVHDAHYSPFGDYFIKRPVNFDAQRLALWLQRHAHPQDTFASGQRDMFQTLTDRSGYDIRPRPAIAPDVFVAWLDERHVRFLFVDRTSPAPRKWLEAAIGAHPLRFQLVSQLPREALYEVKPQAR